MCNGLTQRLRKVGAFAALEPEPADIISELLKGA
jgi:hypothetical protein